MTNTDEVARALNRFSDTAFLNALNERDLGAMTDLVEECFCSSLDEKEGGKQRSYDVIVKNTLIKNKIL